MVKEKITLSIEKEILKRYKKKANNEAINISKKVENFFEEELNHEK